MSENPTPDVVVEEAPEVFDCQRCGAPLPPMDPELARLAKQSGTVLAHAICPGEEPAKRLERTFEVRVAIVELVDRGEVDPPDGVVLGPGDVYTESDELELIAFKASVEALDLDTAMRPLAEKLGEKWMAAEKQAKVADPDD